MAELFWKGVPTINEHIKNIFDEEEITDDSVIRDFRITAGDGKTYKTKHYNLDVIILVGYRVNFAVGGPVSDMEYKAHERIPCEGLHDKSL